jgi:hypothetical protein
MRKLPSQKIELSPVDIIYRFLQPIVHPYPRPFAVRQARVLQIGKMPGYLGLGFVQDEHQVANAKFPLSEKHYYPQPRLI